MAIVYDYTRTALLSKVLGRKQNKFIYTATVEANQAMKRELHPAVHSLLNDYPVKASAEK